MKDGHTSISAVRARGLIHLVLIMKQIYTTATHSLDKISD
jgi:hypothetical protein